MKHEDLKCEFCDGDGEFSRDNSDGVAIEGDCSYCNGTGLAEPVFTKSRVFALLQEIDDDIEEQSEQGSLDRRQVKYRISSLFKQLLTSEQTKEQ